MPANLSWGNYSIAVPDFSNISEDVQQAALQVQEYQRQRAQQKQQRKDMMWRQFMQNTDIKTPEFNNEQLQEIKSGVTEGYRRKLQKMTKEADESGDQALSWEQIARARRVKNQTQSTLNQLNQSYEQWLTEVEMAKKDPDDYDPESIKKATSWNFGEKPIYEPQLKPKKKRLIDILQEEKKEFDAGDVVAQTKEFEAHGEFSRSSVEFAKRYNEFVGEGANKMVKPKKRPRMEALRTHVIQGNKDAILNEWKNLDEDERQVYQMQTEQEPSVFDKPWEAMVYNEAVNSAGWFSVERDTKPIDKDKDGGDQDEKIDYQKDAKDIQDLPRDIAPVDKYSKVSVKGGREGMSETIGDSRGKAKLFSIEDANITFSGNQLNNAYIKSKKNKWSKKGATTYDDIKLTGIVDIEGKKYGKLRARLAEKPKKTSDGQQIYFMMSDEGRVEGTAGELRDRFGYESTAEVEQSSRIHKAKTDSKYTDVIVSVEDNPELEKYYDIENEPDRTSDVQTEQQQTGNIIQGF